MIANPHGIFGAGAHRSVQQFTRFHAAGGGREVALGAMHFAYGLPDTSAETLVEAGLSAAAEFDQDTGGPFVVRTIKLTSP